MNLLFVSNDPTIFDAQSAARARMRAYADEAARHGGVLHILSPAPRSLEAQDGPLMLHAIRVSRWGRVRALTSHARAIIAAHGIDIVSAQDPFEHGFAALKAIQGTSARLHVQVHTDFLSPWFVRGGIFRSPTVRMPGLNQVRRKLADQVLPQASAVRVVSQRIKDSLVARYGASMEAASVIPISVPDTVPPAVPLPSNPFTFTLITVSRLEPEKRIQDIIEAIAQLASRYPRLGLVVVGEGSQRALLAAYAKKRSIANRVQFLGERPDATGLMQSAQAYIQASAYEGYGRTLIEAALAKIPIITTDVGIVGEVFKGYETILAAPPGDPAQLAFNIRWLLEDLPARKELVTKAELAARAHLAAQHTAPADIIADILRTAAPVQPVPAAPSA